MAEAADGCVTRRMRNKKRRFLHVPHPKFCVAFLSADCMMVAHFHRFGPFSRHPV
jgi:Ni,Fe-hydrogenase III small subunit